MPVTVGGLVVEPAAEPQARGGGADAAGGAGAHERDELTPALSERIERALHAKAERRERLRAD